MPASAAQASEMAATRLSNHLVTFLAPLLRTLDQRLDRRLVGTFLATLIAIVEWRNRAHGLLLSELGAYLLSLEQPAALKALEHSSACRLAVAAGRCTRQGSASQ